MSGTREGAERAAAIAVGMTLDEYRSRRSEGFKRCTDCREWLARASFVLDRSRGDGLSARCRSCGSSRARDGYQPKQRAPAGSRRFVAARDEDRKQARRRVNYLVECGAIPRPGSLPCVDCGHTAGGGLRHEYDHHLGYSPEHHEHVEVVCSSCHHKRERSRRG